MWKQWVRQHLTNWRGLSVKAGRNLGVAATCVAGVIICAEVWGEKYPVREWLVWRLLPLWAYTIVWCAACVASGSSILRWALRGQPMPAVERLLHSMVIGLAGLGSLSYVLGALCLFRSWVAVALPILMLASGWYGVPELWRELQAWRARPRPMTLPWRVAKYVAVGWGLVCVGFVYIEALPLNAINFDASWYHMTVAQDYAREGCIVALPGENHKAYPHLTSMIQTWAFLFPLPGVVQLKWMLALHLEFAIVLWRIVGVAAAAHYMLGEKDSPGIWPVFFLFPSIFIYDQCIGGSADHFLGVFAAPMFLAAARTLKHFDWRLGVLTGIAAGGHILTKYQAIYMVVAVAVVFAVRFLYLVGKRLVYKVRRRAEGEASIPGWRAILLAPLAVLLTAAALSSPHFVKNAVLYGNPLYPFGASVFVSSHPEHPRSFYEVRRNRRGGAFAPKYQDDLVRRQLWATGFLFGYSFTTGNRYFTDYTPYMGSLFSLLLPCIVFVRRSKRIWLGMAFAYVAFGVWANTAINDRYLLSFIDLFIAVAAALLVKTWRLGWLARAAIIPLVGMQLFWGGDAMLHYGKKYLKAAVSLVADGYRKRYDAQRLDRNSKLSQITDATPRDAKILVRNFRGLLGLDRTVVSDVYEGQAYVSYVGVRSGKEFWEMLRARGITHLLYPEGRRRPRRLNNAVLFAEVAHFSGRHKKRFGDLVLLELGPNPPPHGEPYFVLTRGQREYRDGLYRVEQLDVDYGKYQSSYPKPKPEVRLSRKNMAELLSRADAVALGRPLPGDGAAVLGRDFVRFEKIGGLSVYLRRKPRAN